MDSQLSKIKLTDRNVAPMYTFKRKNILCLYDSLLLLLNYIHINLLRKNLRTHTRTHAPWHTHRYEKDICDMISFFLVVVIVEVHTCIFTLENFKTIPTHKRVRVHTHARTHSWAKQQINIIELQNKQTSGKLKYRFHSRKE